MSESSELLMQCDEEDLDPWQNGNDDAKSDGNKSNSSKNNKGEFVLDHTECCPSKVKVA